MGPEVVMKFGGTSVGTAEAMRQVASLVASEPRWPVVVVSALGGVTNKLLDTARRAVQGEDWEPALHEIIGRHHTMIADLELEPNMLQDLEEEMERWLRGVALLREMSPRVKDALLSLGERMSVRLLAGVLTQQGVVAKARPWASWELGLETDGRHNKADVLSSCLEQIQNKISQLSPGEVPVITGFIGRSIDGEITTLGRGGSDFSAAVFGAAIGVQEIQIWTDVPGFLRADPRVVEDPALIPAMEFDEAAELAYFGAKVLHPRTLEPARKRNIPVRVMGTFHVKPDELASGKANGTLITNSGTPENVRALAIRENVDTLHIHSLRMLEAPGFLARIFNILANFQISVDVLATSEVSVSMTFDNYERPLLEKAIKEIEQFAKVNFHPDRSIICLVGSKLRNDTTLIGRVFSLLGQNEIPLEVISQGASQINLSFVTEAKFGRLAMKVLHDEFFIAE
ncbi:MAG: aspartate kinase [Deltaproteobacteria bacterium]|nr:MAG: aspartate kinase [Deltaproteobacteria bacterium]